MAFLAIYVLFALSGELLHFYINQGRRLLQLTFATPNTYININPNANHLHSAEETEK